MGVVGDEASSEDLRSWGRPVGLGVMLNYEIQIRLMSPLAHWFPDLPASKLMYAEGETVTCLLSPSGL